VSLAVASSVRLVPAPAAGKIECIVVGESEGLSMSPDDAADAPSIADGDDAPPVGVPDRGCSATLDPGRTKTIDHADAEPTSFATESLAPAEASTVTGACRVPGFDLLEPLGEGGMGVVWKARQAKLNRLVALKMVLGEQRAGSKD